MKLYNLKEWKNNLDKIPKESKNKEDIKALLFYYFINYQKAQVKGIYGKTFNCTGKSLQKEWKVDVFRTRFGFWNDETDVIMKKFRGRELIIVERERTVFK